MTDQFKRILCPVDLSQNGMASIPLAATIAKNSDSKLVFYYVAPQWLPQESMIGTEYINSVTEADRKELEQLVPTDSSVQYEHVFVHGNAGPLIVAESQRSDMVVMSTHGHSGFVRFLIGSVAQYVLRHSHCPVVLVRNPDIKKYEPPAETDAVASEATNRFVTEVMHQVTPIHAFDNITSVLEELKKTRETAAPVINAANKCIGILTTTDIEKYCSLKKRFESKDPTVVDEMFEVDKYGQWRASNHDFNQVERHMTSPVVTVKTSESVGKAVELFEANPNIHHLVVLDECERAVGVVDALQLVVEPNHA